MNAAPKVTPLSSGTIHLAEQSRSAQAAAQGKHIGQPKGLNPECLGKVKKALEKGLSVAETVELTSISFSSVKRYRNHLQAALSH